ncbi:MAG: hypothetical protein JRF37_10515 [Deltaproteobacteria bacterium]|nr:hypothetical protein [Deltaproteobacteria bacterium]
MRALHLELFTVSSFCGLFTSPSRLGPLETNFIPKMKLQAKPNKIRLVNAALEKIDHCVAAVESCEGELTKDGYSQLRAQLGEAERVYVKNYKNGQLPGQCEHTTTAKTKKGRRAFLTVRPLKNANFCLSSRKTKILTAGIH